jgi:hypothetical protein
MVRRVAIGLLAVCLVTLLALPLSVSAGPPPAYCRPAPCHPAPFPATGSVCAGILNACTNIAGACLGIPSMITSGLMAPPPPMCGPVPPPGSWGPVCPPPRRFPKRIRKCSAPVPIPSRAVPMVFTVPQHPKSRDVSGPQDTIRHRPPAVLASSPPKTFSMAGGALVAPQEQRSPVAYADTSVSPPKPVTGCYW